MLAKNFEREFYTPVGEATLATAHARAVVGEAIYIMTIFEVHAHEITLD
jgi:hypothetical protein